MYFKKGLHVMVTEVKGEVEVKEGGVYVEKGELWKEESQGR